MGSAGLEWDTADVITKARLNQKNIFVGTGAQINALTPTYSGQHVYCTSTGSGFVTDKEYVRNTANSAWNLLNTDDMFFGDGSDGDVTISSNTDLGASNIKNYNTLTINSGVYLTGNSPIIIRVRDTLTFVDGTSIIKADEKGGAGGTSTGSLTGGSGGGQVSIFAKTISGAGKITSNGGNGASTSGNGSTYHAGNGGNGGFKAGVSNNASSGAGGINTDTSNHGAGGGAMAGNGGAGHSASGGVAHSTLPVNILEGRYDGAGGGSGSTFNGYPNGAGGGGAGGFVRIYSVSSIPALTLEAKGGTGGNGTHGGGGGSGGYIWTFTLSTDSSSKSVTGGSGGTGGSTVAGSSGSTLSVIG